MLSSKKGFLPYSKAFLQEIQAESSFQPNDISDVRINAENQQRPFSPGPVDNRFFKVMEIIKDSKYLIQIEDNCAIYMSGHSYLTPLKCCLNVDGYTVGVAEAVAVSKSSWHPAARISLSQSSSKPSKSDKALSSILQDIKVNLGSLNNIFLVSAVPSSEWLTVSDRNVKAGETQVELSPGIWTSSLVLNTSSFTIAASSWFERMKMEIMTFPTSWQKAIEELSRYYKSYKPIKMVACGAKGTGKSSFVKFCISNHFSQSQTKKLKNPICLIDCDLGQPELTISGVVSLHILNEPLLSSTHLNLRKPLCSYFLGDITSRNEPELFCNTLRKLYSFYEDYRQKYIQKKLNSVKKANAISSNNKFSMLYDEESSKGQEKANNYENSIPLIINTDGFIRYMGAEILSAILDIVQPSHIFNLYSLKDPMLALIDSAEQKNADTVIMKIESPVQSSTASPFRPQPAELRNMRILSYFLRRSSQVNNQSMVMENLLYTSSLKNGTAVGGNHGIFALSLLSIPPYIIPFSKIIFNRLNNNLQLSEIPAILNGSIVAISYVENGEEKSEILSNHLQCSDSTKLLRLESYSTFQLLPFEGAAIVRAVDLARQCLCLITPVEIDVEQIRIVLTIGAGTVTIPNYLSYGDGFPNFPYYVSEGCGEGSSQLKPRPNLKRKGQEMS